MHRPKISQTQNGHSLIEMTCALVVIIPAFLCLIDLYFLVMGYWCTASVCSVAARAASQGPPNALARKAPEIRAKQVLENSSINNSSTLHLEDYKVTENITRLPDPSLGGAVTGSVTVSLDVTVTPPFCLKLVCPEQKFAIQAAHTCPYTYVVSASTKQPGAGPKPVNPLWGAPSN